MDGQGAAALSCSKQGTYRALEEVWPGTGLLWGRGQDSVHLKKLLRTAWIRFVRSVFPDWQPEERVRSLLLVLPRAISHQCRRSCVVSWCCVPNYSFLRGFQFLEKWLLGNVFCYEGQRLTPFPAFIATCLKNLCLEIFSSSLDTFWTFSRNVLLFPIHNY